MSFHQVRLRISGRVQGVGFRYFAKRSADKLGITGWVENLPDGSVLSQCQGTEEALKEFIAKLRQGPLMSKVEEVSEEHVADNSPLLGFEVRRS